ncbi:MAG: carbamoyltransferase [Polyangiales bacterium]
MTSWFHSPLRARLGNGVKRLSERALRPWLRRRGIESPGELRSSPLAGDLRRRLEAGETLYILGVTTGTHNAGLALLEASVEHGIRLLANHEEERFSGVKHDHGFPSHCAKAMQRTLRERGKSARDICAFVGSFDYLKFAACWAEHCVHDFPANLPALRDESSQDFMDLKAIVDAPAKLSAALGLRGKLTLHGLAHHLNHAWGSYALSPFFRSETGPVMVLVTDGMGDDTAISSFVAENGEMRRVGQPKSLFDSLGLVYQVLSSTQGGWTPLSSEGRYMGAAAWGDGERATNPYYQALRPLLILGPNGEVRVNRRYANWQNDPARPYTEELIRVLGPPIPRSQLWNPDAVLNVEGDARNETEQRLDQVRLDRAAAVQLVFEDAVVHLVAHLIKESGSHKLIWTGGSALNCTASAHLLEHFDGLHLWVPPFPGDAGAAAGAAIHLVLNCGVALAVHPLTHAFYCGAPPRARAIKEALADSRNELESRALGNVCVPKQRDAIADLTAFLLSKDAVVALYQGAAETGPRALGHRSILANPTNPKTLEVLNARVKRRERVRPLAPMVTRESAERYFELAEGASTGDYNAYRYMVLTARAKAVTRERAPAIVHVDGTSRIQIVHAQTDPLCHAILRAMGRHVGVEIMVNTSMNVGSPIVQTPTQAAELLRRARGMHGALCVDDEGEARMVWRRDSPEAKELDAWFSEWQTRESD